MHASRLARRHPAGRRARPPRRRHPQPDALRVPGAVHQGAGPGRACRRQSRPDVRRHGLAYTAGVLAAFAALGAVLLGLRAAGAEVGWGFQLQSPVTVAVLAYVLFAMGLSLSGVFHLGGSLQGVGAAPDAALGPRRLVLRPACSPPWWRRRARRRSWPPPSASRSRSRPAVALAVILALGLGPRAAVPAAHAGAAPDRPPAAPRRLDGDAEAAAGLPGLRHGGLAGLGAEPAGRAGRLAGGPDRPRADRPCRLVVQRRADGRRPGAGAWPWARSPPRWSAPPSQSPASTAPGPPSAPQIGIRGRLRALHASSASPSCWPPTAPCSST